IAATAAPTATSAQTTRPVPRRLTAKTVLPHSAALEMGAEEVLATGGRHRGGGTDLERERRRSDQLREPIDLAGPGAAHQLEPALRVGKRRPAADRPDLDPGEADRDVEAAVDA